jgi:hypothetical protein
MQAALCVSQIVTRGRAPSAEPPIVGFCVGGAARPDDRNLVGVDPFCGAHRSTKILRANAPIHAREMIGTG